MELVPHPSLVATALAGVSATARRAGDRLQICYTVADPTTLRLTPGAAERTDGLWRHTCFEAFVAGTGSGYREFNFAPSGAWAAYAFDNYRDGMRNADAAPAIDWRDGVLTVEVIVPVEGGWQLNLTAVIEESDGTKSYWALAHPEGPPDFHNANCFVLTLPTA